VIEGLPISMIALAINVLGLPGLIFIIWYVDQKRLDKVLRNYKEDLARVVRMYEDNVLLVKNHQRLADDLVAIIQLNTQVQTRLVEKIDNNMFCPLVRKEGPKQ